MYVFSREFASDVISPEIAAKVLRSDTASDVPRRATLEATPDTLDDVMPFEFKRKEDKNGKKARNNSRAV